MISIETRFPRLWEKSLRRQRQEERRERCTCQSKEILEQHRQQTWWGEDRVSTTEGDREGGTPYLNLMGFPDSGFRHALSSLSTVSDIFLVISSGLACTS